MRRRVFLVGLSALALVVLSLSPAWASNWLGHTAGYDSSVTFNANHLTADFYDALIWNNRYNVRPTDVNPWTYSNSSYEREVETYDANYGDTGWAGRWYCYKWSLLYNVCEVGVVQWNLYYAPYSMSQERHLACHEVGHALGLAHADRWSCMRTVAEYADAYDYKIYSWHDENHINYNY